MACVISDIDTTTTLLGQRLARPFFPSPTAGNRLFHTEGERAVARAAADAGLVREMLARARHLDGSACDGAHQFVVARAYEPVPPTS